MATLLKKILDKLSFSEKAQDIVVSESTIVQWLVQRMAKLKNIAPDQVDINRSFEQYGLDSIVAIRIVGDLEKFMDQRLSPALLYEYHTIADVSKYLASELEVSEA
ncbi:acyl carrier protein [Reinekea sp.]|uniref:acyl carrier protein n=1 Tax=Reinekea sp. TaxID=1970455 RepID=UPI00257D9F02|nr:acyl carrier protein [Reinekea sp.]